MWQGRETIYNFEQHGGMMSQSVVIECLAGSQVWLESASGTTDSCRLYGSDQQESTFSGYLIQSSVA